VFFPRRRSVLKEYEISLVVVFCYHALNLLVDEGHLLLNMTGTVVGYVIIIYSSLKKKIKCCSR
jgi:hypothetical protein